jgi:hypothetical protein
MKLLICGGRDYDDENAVRSSVDRLKPDLIITGGASGADALGAKQASRLGCASEVYKADWKTHGRAAGPIRNQKMLDEGKPDLVLAFPGGRGTADMVSRARRAGIPVHEWGEDSDAGDSS